MAILDRWEPVTARRIHTILLYSGLLPSGVADDEPGDPLVCSGDLVALRQCDHVDADRPMRLRVHEVWPSPQWRSSVLISGREVNSEDPDRDGTAVNVRAFKDALARPGAVVRPDRTDLTDR